MPVVPVSCVEMAAGDQSAGADAKLKIEGVADQAVFYGQALQ